MAALCSEHQRKFVKHNAFLPSGLIGLKILWFPIEHWYLK